MSIRTFASIRFMGDQLDPVDVTRALRLPFDHTHKRGEPKIVRRRTDGVVRQYAPYRFGMWSMSSEAWVESDELNDHVCWLLDQLEERKEAVCEILALDNNADIFCFLSHSGSEPCELPEETRQRAASLGIPIEIDHYDLRED